MTQNNNPLSLHSLDLGQVPGPQTQHPQNGPAAQDSSAGSTPSSWKSLVEFKGAGSTLFFIYLKNFFLTLITLGIYSFWARNNVRRYLWEQTFIFGEPLEYTGTGKELFISFLIVMPLFILFIFSGQFLALYMPGFGTIIWMLALIFFWQFASYRTFRYRLTRTRWRGIRCNLTGSALSYAWKAVLYNLLTIVSFGLLLPFSVSRTLSMKLNNVHVGSRPLQFNGTAKGLYKAIFIPMMTLIVFAAGVYGIMIFFAMTKGHLYDFKELQQNIIACFVLIMFASVLLGSFIEASLLRWMFRHMLLGEMRTRSRVRGEKILITRVLNTLLIVFTLGIGYAWAYLKIMRVVFNPIEYTGDPKVEELLQDTGPAPKYGEGLLEALDVDMAI